MLTLRKAQDRGHADHGWLDTWHSFSFAGYQDPAHDQFRALRVLNEDRVRPGTGFGAHGHRDMEIFTWVLEGALAHEDSTGQRGVLRPGEAQLMTAGRGIRHSEFNASTEAGVHFLQIWVLPERLGLEPSYAQKTFPAEARSGRLALLASRGGRDGSLAWNQDVDLHTALLSPGQRVVLPLRPGRAAWVQVARGALEVGDLRVEAGDGVAAEGLPELAMTALEGSEVLVFDLA